MYTILVNDDDSLIVTVKQRIMQRSSMVSKLHFLCNQIRDNIDYSDYTVNMEYVLPVSKKYISEILTKSEELYKDMLEYKIPLTSKLTSEAGDIEISLTFLKTVMDEDGKITQYVRKTSTATITIVPIAAWADYIPDEALSAIDQRLLKVDAQIQALSDVEEMLATKKADDLILTDDLLQVSANGEPLGTGVHIIVPTVDDGELDGEKDGILDLDNIDLDNFIPINKPNDNETDDDFIELDNF